MPRRLRMRRHLFWPACRCGGWWHHPYGPPPYPWWVGPPTREEAKKDLEEYVEMLKEELKNAEERIKELGRSGKVPS